MNRHFSLFAFALILFAAPVAAQEPVVVAPVHVQEVTSPGGLKAWLVQDNKLPLIAMQFAFRGGVEQDPSDKQGLAELTAALLTQGAGSRDAEQFQQALAAHSIQLSIDASRDALQGGIKTLAKTRNQAFALLHDALTAPRFEPDDIERARQQQLASLRLERGDPDWQARHALLTAVFQNHPYSQLHNGTTATLRSLTRDDLKKFASRHLARDNLMVAVAGAITPQELALALDRVFGDLPAQAQLTPVSDVVIPEKPVALLLKREGTQTKTVFALPMLRRDDPDWYAAEIVNYILGGGGFSSRLMHELRDNEGLTYGIGTSLLAMEHAALLFGQAFTDNAKTGKALDLMKVVWCNIYRQGFRDDEIEAARDYLTGSLPLALTSTNAIAGMLLDMQMRHLGMDYLDRYPGLIRKVTREDVQRVLTRWFDPGRLTYALVGKPEGVIPTATQEQTRD